MTTERNFLPPGRYRLTKDTDNPLADKRKTRGICAYDAFREGVEFEVHVQCVSANKGYTNRYTTFILFTGRNNETFNVSECVYDDGTVCLSNAVHPNTFKLTQALKEASMPVNKTTLGFLLREEGQTIDTARMVLAALVDSGKVSLDDVKVATWALDKMDEEAFACLDEESYR